VPVSLSIIQFKAKSLLSKLKEKNGKESHNIEFNASRSWFKQFKNRYNFHNIKVTGEAASADQSAADAFMLKLKKIIEKVDTHRNKYLMLTKRDVCFLELILSKKKNQLQDSKQLKVE
jgi:ABC-type Zn uptake system ZnuABC Zn-binding protein ZnuA